MFRLEVIYVHIKNKQLILVENDCPVINIAQWNKVESIWKSRGLGHNKMEFPDVGQRCSVATCQQLGMKKFDTLPILSVYLCS